VADTSRPQDAANPHPTVGATPARQARTVRPIFWVLVISTLLAAIALALAWAWKAPGFAQPGSQVRATNPDAAQAFHAPEPAAQVPPPGTDHTSPGAPTPQTP
jgi:hypothetical protein